MKKDDTLKDVKQVKRLTVYDQLKLIHRDIQDLTSGLVKEHHDSIVEVKDQLSDSMGVLRTLLNRPANDVTQIIGNDLRILAERVDIIKKGADANYDNTNRLISSLSAKVDQAETLKIAKDIQIRLASIENQVSTKTSIYKMITIINNRINMYSALDDSVQGGIVSEKEVYVKLMSELRYLSEELKQ